MFSYSVSIFNQQGNMIDGRTFDSTVEPEVIVKAMVGYRVTFQQNSYIDQQRNKITKVEMQVSPVVEDKEHVTKVLSGLDQVGAYSEVSLDTIRVLTNESTITLGLLKSGYEDGLLVLEARGRILGLRGDLTMFFGDVANSTGPTNDELHRALSDALNFAEKFSQEDDAFSNMVNGIAAEIYSRYGKDGLNMISEVAEVLHANMSPVTEHVHKSCEAKTTVVLDSSPVQIPEVKPYDPRAEVERAVAEIEDIVRPHSEKQKRHSAYFTLMMGNKSEIAIVMEMDEVNYNRMVEESVMGLLASKVPNGSLEGSCLLCDPIPNYLAFFKTLLETNSYSIISMRPMSPASLDFDNGLTAL